MKKNKFDPFIGCKVGQSDPIVIRSYLDEWLCLVDVYAKIDMSKHVQTSGKHALLSFPFREFLSARRAKIPNHDKNQ